MTSCHYNNKGTLHSNYFNLNLSVIHTCQPLAEKFIVKPSHYIILHQIENENVGKTYIGPLDMKKSNLFLWQSEYLQTLLYTVVHTPN